ncbi:MAG: hypothetical protein KDJ52_08970 [Anaerolineae bacterium]|nr:hypothetical protein [Anaerolineae bacterium]
MKFWQSIGDHSVGKLKAWQLIGVGIGLMSLGLLSACGGISNQPEAVSQPVAVDEVQPENDGPSTEATQETEAIMVDSEASNQAAPITEANQSPDESVEAPVEIAAVEPTTEIVVEAQTEPPPSRPLDQFYPTDPATVNLASGQVQLVEFFAFW